MKENCIEAQGDNPRLGWVLPRMLLVLAVVGLAQADGVGMTSAVMYGLVIPGLLLYLILKQHRALEPSRQQGLKVSAPGPCLRKTSSRSQGRHTRVSIVRQHGKLQGEPGELHLRFLGISCCTCQALRRTRTGGRRLGEGEGGALVAKGVGVGRGRDPDGCTLD